MRNPVLACAALVIGASAFACATSASPDLGDFIAERNATDPADAGTESIRVPTSTQTDGPATVTTVSTPPVAPPPVVFDAGSGHVADAGKGDDDDDDDTGTGGSNCPQTEQYQDEALAAAFLGGATSCAKSASACAADECCAVNAISSTANLCVPR